MQTSTFTLRAPATDDVPAVVALASVDDERSGDHWTTTEEDVLHDWRAPGFDPGKMVRLAETGGAIVGMFTITPGTVGTARSHGFVHPDHRGIGVGSALLRWGVDAAKALGIQKLFSGSSDDDAPALFERAGFTYARTFIHMINPNPAAIAPPEWPAGVHLAALKGEDLVQAVVEALDGSFIDHWNFRPADPAEFRHLLEDPGEDPALWFIARADDGRIAGVNICRLKEKDGVVRGNLGPIGTTRPFRRIGLGRALLRHGVLEMAARGAVEVGLGVDSENPSNAVALYEHNGFERRPGIRVFQKEL